LNFIRYGFTAIVFESIDLPKSNRQIQSQ